MAARFGQEKWGAKHHQINGRADAGEKSGCETPYEREAEQTVVRLGSKRYEKNKSAAPSEKMRRKAPKKKALRSRGKTERETPRAREKCFQLCWGKKCCAPTHKTDISPLR